MASERVQKLDEHLANLIAEFGEDSSTVKDWSNYIRSVKENEEKQARINRPTVFS